MNVTRQTIVLAVGDALHLKMPDGTQVDVGFGGDGQVEPDKGWVMTTDADGTSERAFTVQKNGKLKEYNLQ